MTPYSTNPNNQTASTNRYLTPYIHQKDGTKALSFNGLKGVRYVVGGGRNYIVLVQPNTVMKQSMPFFTRITLDITDVVITREYVESVYNITGGLVTKLSDNIIGSCVQNNGLAGFAITDSNMALDKVFFANNTVIEIYKR